MLSWTSLAQGFGLTLGLIVAIGAQNALLLSQAIRNQHQWLMAAICIALDILLISSGVLGLGTILALWPGLLTVFKWGGALFLAWYGWQALQQARNPGQLVASDQAPISRRQLVLTTLAVTLLNPHVYLDTVMLIGGVGAQVAVPDRYGFLMGAWTASICWFVSLCVAGRLLQPLFTKPQAWRILYILVALTMWVIAAVLILSDG